MTLTAKDVAEITRLLEESPFDELTLQLDGLKLNLRRHGAAPASDSLEQAAQPVPAGLPQRPAETVERQESAAGLAPASAERAGAVEPCAATWDVIAPLLGTFYRAPKPGAPPFVEIGSQVEEDTIIGIIEVMKLMNTVRAGARGTVADILAADGVLVEYGQTLLRIRRPASA